MKILLYSAVTLSLMLCAGESSASASRRAVATNDLIAGAPQEAVTARARLAELERRNAILEAKAELADEAYSQFQLGMAGLAVLITLLVFGFGIITHRSAVAAARQEIADLKDRLRSLHDEAAAATAEALDAAKIAKRAAQGARTHQQSAEEASEKMQDAVAIADRLLSLDDRKAKLTVEEQETVAEAAKELAEKPQHQWTADEFKVKLLEADAEEKWEEMLQLAKGMEFFHANSSESFADAIFYQALALWRLGRGEEAVAAYDRLNARLRNVDPSEVQINVIRSLVSNAIMLSDLGRYNEAIAASDIVVGLLESRKEPRLRLLKAKAWVNRGFILSKLRRWREAVAVNDKVISLFGTSSEPKLRVETALALYNKACCLACWRKVRECIGTLNQWKTVKGGFDCQRVANDPDFDTIRTKPTFVSYLRKQGCVT